MVYIYIYIYKGGRGHGVGSGSTVIQWYYRSENNASKVDASKSKVIRPTK